MFIKLIPGGNLNSGHTVQEQTTTCAEVEAHPSGRLSEHSPLNDACRRQWPIGPVPVPLKLHSLCQTMYYEGLAPRLKDELTESELPATLEGLI